MGTNEFSGLPDKILEEGAAGREEQPCGGLASLPRGGVGILLLASCYGNRNKLRLKSYMARVQSLPFTHLYLSFMKSLQNWYQSSIIDGVEGRQISKCQRECQKVFEKIIQRYESLTDNSYLRSPVTVCYFRSRRVYGSTMGHSPSGYKLSRHLWCQSSHVIS